MGQSGAFCWNRKPKQPGAPASGYPPYYTLCPVPSRSPFRSVFLVAATCARMCFHFSLSVFVTSRASRRRIQLQPPVPVPWRLV